MQREIKRGKKTNKDIKDFKGAEVNLMCEQDGGLLWHGSKRCTKTSVHTIKHQRNFEVKNKNKWECVLLLYIYSIYYVHAFI